MKIASDKDFPYRRLTLSCPLIEHFKVFLIFSKLCKLRMGCVQKSIQKPSLNILSFICGFDLFSKDIICFGKSHHFMGAGVNKFLRIYYGKVTEFYRDLKA